MKLFTLIFTVLCLPIAALAEQGEAEAAVDIGNQSAYLVQVLLGLLFVLAMIFAMGWLLRRMGQGSLVGNQHLKIVASLSLGTREKIALVQVGESQLLLGVTPNAINTLQTFQEPVVVAANSPNASEFSQRLKSILQKSSDQK